MQLQIYKEHRTEYAVANTKTDHMTRNAVANIISQD